MYVAFIVGVLTQQIVGCHAFTAKRVDLVMTPLRIAQWQRGEYGKSVVQGGIHYSKTGARYTTLHLTEHLSLEGITRLSEPSTTLPTTS